MSSYVRFRIGFYTVVAHDWGLGYEWHVRHTHNPGMTIPFPTERAALDWIFWMVMGRERPFHGASGEHLIGAWLVEKYRDQAKHDRALAYRNMKKQGLPPRLISHILDGV